MEVSISISITSCYEVIYVNCLQFCHLLFVGLTRNGEMRCARSIVVLLCSLKLQYLTHGVLALKG